MAIHEDQIAKEPLSLLSFGVKQPVAANLLMFAIIFSGLIFGATLRREMFPEIKPNRIAVSIIYPGASPEEVEEGVALKVEDKVANLDDVDEITTTLVEGSGTVMLELRRGADDINDVVNDVKAALDTIDDLPEEAEELRTTKFEAVLPVITISVAGNGGEAALKRAIREIRDDLERLPGLGEVQTYGTRNDEIRVEVTPSVLVKYGLSLPELADQIRRYMAEVPGGTVRTDVEAVRIRTMGTNERAEAIRNIVVKTDAMGSVVRLGEIAKVTEGFADQDLRARIDGRPSASATIVNTNDGDTVYMANLVRAYAAGASNEPFHPSWNDRFFALKRRFSGGQTGGPLAGDAEPGGGTRQRFVPIEQLSPRELAYYLGQLRASSMSADFDIVLSDDLARFIEDRLDLLTRNALAGAVLVFLVLLIALNIRVALWVMAGLVVSLLGTLAFMSLIGTTLNLMTMFGLIVVLGLLVDDAIVVAENIVARNEEGESALAAAINGTKQIAWPVVATVLTTIAAFLPLRLIHGQIGDFLGTLPVVVACALSVSMLEAMIILPAHMGHSLRRAERGTPGRFGKFFETLENRRNHFIQNRIVPGFAFLVDRILYYRYIATATALSIWIISVGLVAGGRVEFTFFPSTDSEILVINLRMPVGTSIESTDAMARRIEDACINLDEVRVAKTLVGAQLDTNDWATAGLQSHVAQIILELQPVEVRDVPSSVVISRIRDDLGQLTGVSSLRFEELQGGPGGQAINFVVTGKNIDRLKTVAERLKARLREFDGVFDISDDLESGQRELQIHMLDGASSLGLTPTGIAEQIRGALYGLEPHTFAANREDVKVRLMFDESSRQTLAGLEDLYIFTPRGRRVPLSEVARIDETTSYATIKRLDRERAVTVLGDVDQSITNPETVVAAMQPYFSQLEDEYPDVHIEARGRQLEMQKSMAGIRVGFVVAILLIYIILAWLFRSYFQPIAVMLGIPFAIIGVVWGHYLTGFNMMILSLIGFVALTGIVVNDSLIYMEFYNHRRREGARVHEALVETSRRRLRPIVMTTATTVLGLLPLMLERSFQARFLIPMAVAISFGLMSATLLILVVLPCLIVIGHDIRCLATWLWYGGRQPEAPRDEPDSDLPFTI